MKNTMRVSLANAIEMGITFVITFCGCYLAGEITEKYRKWWKRKIEDSNIKIAED